VKLPVYKHLLDINAGFDQVIRGLAALRKLDSFHERELDHYTALAKEARAATELISHRRDRTCRNPRSWPALRETLGTRAAGRVASPPAHYFGLDPREAFGRRLPSSGKLSNAMIVSRCAAPSLSTNGTVIAGPARSRISSAWN
jgi:hypothetical protein